MASGSETHSQYVEKNTESVGEYSKLINSINSHINKNKLFYSILFYYTVFTLLLTSFYSYGDGKQVLLAFRSHTKNAEFTHGVLKDGVSLSITSRKKITAYSDLDAVSKAFSTIFWNNLLESFVFPYSTIKNIIPYLIIYFNPRD